MLISSVALRFFKDKASFLTKRSAKITRQVKRSWFLKRTTINFTARVITSLIRKYFVLAKANMTMKEKVRIVRTGVLKTVDFS